MNKADEISQREKREILANDRRMATYHAAAQASIDDHRGGRYGAIGRPTVTGAGPINCPRQPEGSTWASDPIGKEPALGIDVYAMEPVGEMHERIEAKSVRRGWRRL